MIYKKVNKHKFDDNGFTIIELMIALTVLSTLLVASTAILSQIGVLYTKGVNSADLQNTTRTVSADIAAAVQFSSTPPSTAPDGSYADGGSSVVVRTICVGPTRYTFVKDRELGDDTGKNPVVTTKHVLWRDSVPEGTCTAMPASNMQANTPTSNGYEMAGKHMRINKFVIADTGTASETYNVNVWMSYGDSDLVVNGSPAEHKLCSGAIGTQFCGVSEINTMAAGRNN